MLHTLKPYNNILGLDGKLKPEELECWHKNKLCIVWVPVTTRQVNALLQSEDTPQSFKLGKNQRMFQGRRSNPRDWKTKRQLFEHGAIGKLPKQRQHCTGNTVEFHFPLSKFLPSFPHICLCIRACSSICSVTICNVPELAGLTSHGPGPDV